jgi:glycerophosphoryl diester phosphodiesterase
MRLHLISTSLAVLLVTNAFASPFIVAHRGASHDAPENTLPSFRQAWVQGADAIEGDFHLTRDGRIICIHDYDTLRVSGTKLVVKDAKLEELRALDAGAWFKPEWKGTRLPTFMEVAATVPAGKKFYIEVKCGPEIVPTLLSEIREAGLKSEQVVVISFNAPVIRELKKLSPTLKACWLSGFKKGGTTLKPDTAEALVTLKDIHADGFSSQADSRIDAAFIQGIRKEGFEYHCWTIDDPKQAQHFLEIGAQSITTNRPAFLRAALKAD